MATINQWIPPHIIKGVQSFLGFCNFYQHFIKDYDKVAQPFNCLTQKDQPFYFDVICRQAFNKLKRQLVSAPLLTHFHSKQPLMLKTNASDSIIASVFSQKQPDGEWHPIAYYLKTMIDAELNYPIYNKKNAGYCLQLSVLVCTARRDP